MTQTRIRADMQRQGQLHNITAITVGLDRVITCRTCDYPNYNNNNGVPTKPGTSQRRTSNRDEGNDLDQD